MLERGPLVAKWKCTFLFNLPKAGWSESWYIEKSQIREAVTPCKNLAAIRTGGMGNFGLIEAVRISSVDPPQISVIEVLNYKAGLTGSTDFADTPWQGIQVKMTDPNEKYQRTQLFRGVPDWWIARRTGDGQFDLQASPSILAWKNSIVTSLRSNGFLFRARSGEGAAGLTFPASNFTANGVGARITFDTAGPPAVGAFVTFKDVKDGNGVTQLKGSHKVRSVAGQTVTLETVVPSAANPASWTAGTHRLKLTEYFPVHFGQLQRPSSRDTGRPFFLRRGRQPAKAK